jgi:hypothetical protein
MFPMVVLGESGGSCLSIPFSDRSLWKMGPLSLPQGRPEIKYRLQKGMSRKGSLLAKPSGPLNTSLARGDLCFGLHDHWSCPFVGHMFWARNLGREQRHAYHPQMGPWDLGSVNPVNLTQFPGTDHCATGLIWLVSRANSVK